MHYGPKTFHLNPFPWQKTLRNGAALAERYGAAAGYRYSEREDYGLFWSNDPAIPIGAMLEELAILGNMQQSLRARQIRSKLLQP